VRVLLVVRSSPAYFLGFGEREREREREEGDEIERQGWELTQIWQKFDDSLLLLLLLLQIRMRRSNHPIMAFLYLRLYFLIKTRIMLSFWGD